MKKIFNKAYLVMYRVYNCDQEGSKKAKPFDIFFEEEGESIYESGFARALFSLLLIFAK